MLFCENSRVLKHYNGCRKKNARNEPNRIQAGMAEKPLKNSGFMMRHLIEQVYCCAVAHYVPHGLRQNLTRVQPSPIIRSFPNVIIP